MKQNCRPNWKICLRSVEAAPHFEGDCGRAGAVCLHQHADNHNMVEMDFVNETSVSVKLFPMVELKAELNDWNVENGKVLRRWPRMITR